MSSKNGPKRNRTNRGDLSQYGLFDISNSMGGDDVGEDDSDLEAELLALSSGGGAKPKRPQRQKVVPDVNLDAMVAASLKDVPSDDDDSSVDDDPDLLNELSEIGEGLPESVESNSATTSPQKEVKEPPTNVVNVLQERLKMYETAEKNAKEAGELNRARRFGRGIKTLQDLLKSARAGRAIKEDDIPPPVAITLHKPEPAPLEPIETPAVPNDEPDVVPEAEIASVEPDEKPEVQPDESSAEKEKILQLLNTRKIEYKTAAVTAKKSGDNVTALNYVKVVKQFEMVIKAVEEGQPVDLSRMPGPPSVPSQTPVEHAEAQASAEDQEEPDEPLPEPVLITASSVAEALDQRLEVYKKQVEKAKEEGNSSKARRMGRIVKQFEDAIKLNNAGKPIPFDSLPCPPGYAPIPVPGSEASGSPKESQPSVPTSPQAPSRPAPQPPRRAPDSPSGSDSHSGKSNAAQARINKHVALLLARQKEFKEAALNAKKKGEVAQAKELLRTAKGFDPLIDAARGGFPIDMATLPVPPSAKSQLEEEYEDIPIGEEASEIDPEHLDILGRLEQQLSKQLKLAFSTRDHNKAIGDIAGMNRFENLALSVTRDLDIVRLAKKSSNPVVPKYHYVTKNFSIVKSFTDLNDNDLELTIMRGINYACSNPKEIDTYVKFEFPYPQEEPVRNRTAIIKNTNNPEYNETFTLPIQRNARQCQRVFKRHGIKFEVFSRGGFFRGDSLVGSVPVKLQPLETQCELHESFDLLEGRKKIGGKLEIRLRLRDPMLTRQVEQLSEKWLVLNHEL